MADRTIELPEDNEESLVQIVNLNEPVTRTHLDALMVRLELRLTKLLTTVTKPQWHIIWSAIGVTLAVLTGLWTLAIDPIKGELASHKEQLNEIHRDLTVLTVQSARTADAVDRLSKPTREGALH